MNHDPKNDAHRLSNYDEIKDRIRTVTDVEVDLSVVGVTPETVEKLLDCISGKKDFVLYNDEDFMAFCPNHMAAYSFSMKQFIQYKSLKQMVNGIKLLMLTLTELEETDLKIDFTTAPKLIIHE